MSDAGIITSFADELQNTARLNVHSADKWTRELTHISRVPIRRFIQDIDEQVCAKINTLTFTVQGGRKFLPALTMTDLRGRSQMRPNSVARQWCWHILKNHRETRDLMGTPSIGREYRRDHTTVISGLNRVRNDIEYRRAYATSLQEVCNDLDRLGYASFYLWD